MGRPIQADGRQTRKAILDAALELFADKGYFGTSLREIAVAVGVRESAFYNYFESKEALFIALLEAAHESKAEQLATFLAEPIGDARTALERLSTMALDHFCEPRQQRFFLILMSDGMRLAKQGHIDLIERMTSGAAPIHELMRRLTASGGLNPGDPELLAIEFMGPLLLWRHWQAINPNGRLVVDRRAFVRNHVNQFLRGAATPPVARTRSAARPIASRPTRAHYMKERTQ